jgi:hypothetical protein
VLGVPKDKHTYAIFSLVKSGPKGLIIVVGDYGLKLKFTKVGRFGNGSWWHSPLFRWSGQDTY